MIGANANVHLWAFNLDAPVPAEWLAALSADEQARATRFVFARDAHRFRHGRATLRGLLGHWCGLAPHALHIGTGPQGKPFLPAHGTCHFNLSHSADQAMVGICATHELGLDLEGLRAPAELPALADQIMTPAELASWTAMPVANKLHAFYQCWTRKEAVLKALGTGLQLEPRTLDVGCSAADATLSTWHAGRVMALSLRTWQPDGGTVASLAVVAPGEMHPLPMNLIPHSLYTEGLPTQPLSPERARA
jgi:4'-phosphopantetheinyl transferase